MKCEASPGITSMPPTPLPLQSSKFYRWKSHTAAQNNTISLNSPNKMKLSDMDLEATWRKPVPRGRIRDLVAAFDQCARFEGGNSEIKEKSSKPTMGVKFGSNASHLETPHPLSISTPKRPMSAEKRTPIVMDLHKLDNCQRSSVVDSVSPLVQRHHCRRGTHPIIFKSSPSEYSAPESPNPSNDCKIPQKLETFYNETFSKTLHDSDYAEYVKQQYYVAEDDADSLKISKNCKSLDFPSIEPMDCHMEQSNEPELYEEDKTLDRSFATSESVNVKTDFSDKENIVPNSSKFLESPKFTSSPTFSIPYAGQRVTEYRITEKNGPLKVIMQNNAPSALATSTPIGTKGKKRTVHEFQDSFVSSITNFSAVDHADDSRRQISRLVDSVDKTRHSIHIAELSLLEAKKTHTVVQELSSQRLLLLCRERLKLQLEEIRRLQALSVVRHPPPPLNCNFKSTMVISNISLHLNKSFHSRGSFAFLVLLKCRTEVESTGVVTMMAQFQTSLNVLRFGEHLHFSNLPVDFVIGMEVYMMKVPEYKPMEKTCAAFLAGKMRKLLVPNNAVHHRPSTSTTNHQHSLLNKTSTSLPGNYSSPECDFKFCGKLILDRDSAGDRQFYLDDVIYPLEGTVKLTSHCSSLPEAFDVEYRGYLYNFHSPTTSVFKAHVSPSWHKYWATLHRGVIFFWSTPQDEELEKIPLLQVDLTKCTNMSIEESRDKTNNAEHEFHIELLVDQNPNLIEKRRVILAAGSSEDLSSWLDAINDTLCILRS